MATVGSRNVLFGAMPKGLDETHLCFNKVHFSRTDFNVDRFINMARRRASLQQIHNDLRVCLKVVQNSMIELINDDYADFVNLSSNLVGLKETVDKLTKDVETIWSEFFASTRDVMTSAEFVEKQAIELIACRQAQYEIKAQLALMKAIERLADKIAGKPTKVDLHWLREFADAVVNAEAWKNCVGKNDSKIAEAHDACLLHVRKLTEDWLVQDLKSGCELTECLLGIISLLNNVDEAVTRVMIEVIDDEHEPSISGSAINALSDLFQNMIKQRKEWISKLEENGASVEKVSPFLDKCLLTHIISVLDQHFGSVLIPSDNRLFHQCYKMTCDFISNWPDASKSRTILRMIRDKFSTTVYFKLETQQLMSDLRNMIDPLNVNIAGENNLLDAKVFIDTGSDWEEKLFFDFSKTVVDALERVWSDEVYLEAISDKAWDFSLKVLTKFLDWIIAVKKYYGTEGHTLENAETWRLFCAVCADCVTVDARTFSIALSSVWPKIREQGLDVTPFGQCLSFFSTKVADERKALECFIVTATVGALSRVMSSVSDIPRHYRWTKKPTPTEPSPYISEASSLWRSYEDEMHRRCWSDEHRTVTLKAILSETMGVFCEKAEQVLNSVEQMGTSLQRFKRRASSAVNENAVESDESKIRAQLLLDLMHCKKWSSNFDIDIPQLDTLMGRATSQQEPARDQLRSVVSFTEELDSEHMEKP